MKNKIKTCVMLATATLALTCCLASCGMNRGENKTEKPSVETPSEMVSDIIDDITPDKNNGRTVRENSDEYTADEKNDHNFMTDRTRNGK